MGDEPLTKVKEESPVTLAANEIAEGKVTIIRDMEEFKRLEKEKEEQGGFSHSILVLLMFIGACAGSTGGGLKVSRIVIGFKSVLTYLGAFLHPRAVRKVKFEDKDVDAETMHAICVYFIAAIGLFVISVLLVALDGFDLVTTFSAVAATFNNIGPGLGVAGPTSNFAAFSDFSKVVMTMDMLLGRLEVFPMLMLFYPPLWKESIGEARIRRNRTALH